MLRIGHTIYDMEIDVTRTYELWEQRETCVRLKPSCDGTLVTCKINGFTVYIKKLEIRNQNGRELVNFSYTRMNLMTSFDDLFAPHTK